MRNFDYSDIIVKPAHKKIYVVTTNKLISKIIILLEFCMFTDSLFIIYYSKFLEGKLYYADDNL